jgi:D-lactate dehydrogenase (cytochrome)
MLKRTDEDALAAFATDESGLYQAQGLEAVCYPTSREEVVALLREANATGTPVTISGAGTGVTGGRVATGGGIVVSTEELRRPEAHGGSLIDVERFGRSYAIAVDEASQEAWVPAGVSLELLAEMLPAGLLYPPDPTEMSAFLGGTLATNASGARTFHYGATRAWVLGLTVVLPNGDTLRIERGQVKEQGGAPTFTGESGQTYTVPLPTYPAPDLKNASGLYSQPGMDLVDLFLGDEGLLGVVTEAHLRLVEAPEMILGEIAFFPEEDEALGFADDLRQASAEGRLTVLSLEFFDAHSLRFIQHEAVEGKAYGAAIYTELAGDLDDLDAFMESLEAHHYVADWFADTEADAKEQKAFRHLLPEGVNSYVRQRGSQKMGTDFVVPAAGFREMLAAYHAAGQTLAAEFPRAGEHYLIFGHLGNDHLHANFLTDTEAELARVRELYAALAQQAIALGGVISGEHGVGKKTALVDGRRVPYLELMVGKEGLLEIARAKRALDPNLILNVGNMVPREYYDEA